MEGSCCASGLAAGAPLGGECEGLLATSKKSKAWAVGTLGKLLALVAAGLFLPSLRVLPKLFKLPLRGERPSRPLFWLLWMLCVGLGVLVLRTGMGAGIGAGTPDILA